MKKNINEIKPASDEMKNMFCFLFFLLLVLTSCQDNENIQDRKLHQLAIDTLFIDDFEMLISVESNLLAQPSQLAVIDENTFAVHDAGLGKIVVFDRNGEKLFEFGRAGSGPGEWDPGFMGLDYYANRFILTDRNAFRFLLFDRDGTHLKTIEIPDYLRLADKKLLAENRVLSSSSGHQESLALILDLDENATIIERIGSPEVNPPETWNFDEIREVLSSGNIPDALRNEALVASSDKGFLILMNVLGELRYYDTDGQLRWQQVLPDEITGPLWDFVIKINQQTRESVFVNPMHSTNLQLMDDRIYLLTFKYPEADERDVRLLVYNLDGNLIRHTVLLDSDDEQRALWDFDVDDHHRLYFVDVAYGRILRWNTEDR